MKIQNNKNVKKTIEEDNKISSIIITKSELDTLNTKPSELIDNNVTVPVSQ